MGYDAAEQAYGEHRFAEAQDLLNEHLTEHPDDPRALLLQAYIHFYGFQDTAAAASSYRRVLELATEGPCLLYTSPSPRDATLSRMPSSA